MAETQMPDRHRAAITDAARSGFLEFQVQANLRDYQGERVFYTAVCEVVACQKAMDLAREHPGVLFRVIPVVPCSVASYTETA